MTADDGVTRGSRNFREYNRLAYITGLRGIAALIVAVGHLLGMVPPDHPTGSLMDADAYHLVIWPWMFGGQMVWLFLMVSGFALYWSEDGRQVRGLPSTSLSVYVRRRAWRIAPTYYAALVLGLAVLAIGRWCYVAPSPSLDTARPVSTGGLLAHLVFVHDLNPAWIHQISPPLWSIAVEVHLYLLFPLVLFGRWRRSPVPAAVALIIAIRLLQQWTGIQAFNLVEFFMAGIILAHVARHWRPLPPLLLSIVAASFVGLGLLRLPLLSSGLRAEVVWLIGFSALLLRLHAGARARTNMTTWRPVQLIGERSYSLYAVHFPVVLTVWWVVARMQTSHAASAVLLIILGMPLVLLVTEACYRWIELPSMRRVTAVDVNRKDAAPAEEVVNG